MEKDKISGNAYDSKLLGRLAKYIRPYKTVFWISVILTILLAAVAPALPLLVEYTLDHYILSGNGEGLTGMLFLMFALLIGQTIIRYFHTLMTNTLGQSVIRDIRIQVFNHITNLRLKYFDNTPIGRLITRTISDLETIANIFSEGLIQIIGDLLQLVVILGVMFYTDWKLTLVVLVPMPLMIAATYIFKEAMKSAFQSVRLWVSNLNTFLQEHISGMNVIQYFAREDQEMRKFKAINAEHRNAHIRANWYFSIFFPVLEIIVAIATGLLVWYGSKQILADVISPGVVVAFIMYINMIFRPIRELIDKFNTLQMGMVSAERIFDVLDTDEFTPNEGKYKPENVKGEITFKNVWFAYNDEKWVLKDVSFHVEQGETLALVGATGAGKSSIINILSRFYEIQKGEILLDGVNIKEYDLTFLRQTIATVLQDVFLFSDSVLHNINLHNPNISFESIEDAAKKVGAYDFIMRLPGNFNYQVQERGSTLSAGQAQLISFIRALVHDPKILILDEATSSIDTETEELIQNAIENLMDGRTSIVIAHRLSTIQKADKIIVLDKGEIKEIGTHHELLELEGYYRKLYDLQFNSAGI
ncbi:ABC transporter ATP-binding protein [Sphingobacterium cellulitidis]|uniref:Xenobiotic ABC transporter ATP-binding protein n=1 Tax=Sphingobacterium cellulitidis TaxID=1768011 RepID=A0A8H9G020_9SPHI|nr:MULTISPECIES: ABC transporter ATP-binding protein [Sphingobacterium]MBA8985323.1 ATP-binding cassette subfamily B protein [Sphingobacterium soli]OYD41515.1 antibiotic ABC transporter ATP-binding protein [Sphingobacterium cellulitidis]OYD45659.1 antibiotic ABC transporter ATP-binding protein [Sphingobacterium cellulitidis]GGE10565.1 xenobiotic ABC transporter ATP-binding protein [Sphingobacterium soli]